MIPGLSSLGDALQGLFSRNFVIAGFMPVAVFAGLSLWPLSILYPETWEALSQQLEDTDVLSTEFSLQVIGLILISYVVWSSRAFFREILEGRYLSSSAREGLTACQTSVWRKLEEQREALRPDRTFLRQVAAMDLFEARNIDTTSADAETVKRGEEQWVNVLHNAIGQFDTGGAGHNFTGNKDLADLNVVITALKKKRDRQESISFSDLDSCRETIESYCEPAQRKTLSESGDQILIEGGQELPFLAQYALAKVEREYSRLTALLQYRFPNNHLTIGPTALANMAEIQRAYAHERYGIDIDVVRPRLQKLIDEDTEFSGVLATTQMHVDINVMMTAMGFLFGLTWFWQMAALSENPMGFLAVIAGSTAATIVFYGLAVPAYRRHGEVLRSAVDLFRFDLLESLHIALPANTTEEQETWGKVMRHMIFGSGVDLEYDHGDDTDDLLELEDDEEAEDGEPGILEAIRNELRERLGR